jgi:plasmid maintenance system antidote protein VapI
MEAIKKAVAETGKSVNAIATESGVPQAVLQRFVTGKRGLTLETAEKLCVYLGLELKSGE